MSHKPVFLILLCLATAGMLRAQTPRREPKPAPQTYVPNTAQMAGKAPTESDIYCAGFFSHAPVESSLAVLGGQDNGLKFEYGDRDLIYLNQGQGAINASGGSYMLIRPVKDLNPREAFPGQRKMIFSMGTLYAEIARIQVQELHKGSATAEIVNACEPVLAGDIAVPLSARSAPDFRPISADDRFAPPSGKGAGLVAAIKEFAESGGMGHIVYLNMGKNHGIQQGSHVRVFRTYQSPSQVLVEQATRNYLTKVDNIPIGRRLTQNEIDTLPREVIGEVLILSSDDFTSTGIITYSWQDVYAGDQVEAE
jgi:hypothetical protein